MKTITNSNFSAVYCLFPRRLQIEKNQDVIVAAVEQETEVFNKAAVHEENFNMKTAITMLKNHSSLQPF